jgi:3-oxoacyl-[acyl-carrier protein] reductase
MSDLGLGGHAALVTGASRGIGAATAIAFAAAGARVVINFHRNRIAADAVALACRAAGGPTSAAVVAADVSDEDDVVRLFDAAEAIAPLDVVVANAGIWDGEPIERMTLAHWRLQVEQNLTSVFLTCREAARRMKPRGRGSIVVLSSTAAQRGEAFHAAYAATKGAALSFVKSLATELGPAGVRVNAVAPGWVMTDMSRAAIEADRAAIEAAIPLRRVASAADIAGPILFLASPLSRHVTGEVLNVNGGSVLAG